jgi:methylated-DNA-protein-cysteine methyltransferase-like protein
MFEKIRKTVQNIPRGKVATYGQVATASGFPGAARQVVWALRGAAGSLPWHRVVGAGGKILLRDHHAMEQRMRLEMEGVKFNGSRVDMKACEWISRAKPRTTPKSGAKAKRGSKTKRNSKTKSRR